MPRDIDPEIDTVENVYLYNLDDLSEIANQNIINRKNDIDKATEDLRLATRHLGMLVGKVDVEEILGSIFNDFCIGK